MPRSRDNAGNVYQYRYFGGFRLLLAMLVMVQRFGADLAPAPMAKALAPYGSGSVAPATQQARSVELFAGALYDRTATSSAIAVPTSVVPA